MGGTAFHHHNRQLDPINLPLSDNVGPIFRLFRPILGRAHFLGRPAAWPGYDADTFLVSFSLSPG